MSERAKQLGGGYLINGDFRVNQCAVSGILTLASGVYGNDRWRDGTGGCTYKFATSGVVTSSAIDGTNLSIEFSTGTLYNAKLEKGTIITPLIHKNISEEEILCKGYYQIIKLLDLEVLRTLLNVLDVSKNFPPMRIVPTIPIRP
ncbi:hypothetical protein [Clostridium sp.]|uniref:hypothetical protein n=1 Tax=Clostridium sp. TaxID=1506 RepID=UPI0028439E0F|nr:hypothetical protein [Clostridium sp.]MDR3596957.1 hypothetical protein [Clostridium sp.]